MITRRIRSRYFRDLDIYPTPGWLMELSNLEQRLPIANILQESVFYPASSMDENPVKYLAGLRHSFVYTDWNITQDILASNLDTLISGYRCAHSRSVTAEELCIDSFQAILPERVDDTPTRQFAGQISPYALWAIYDRVRKDDELNGPERLSLLFVGGEGVATFQSLYYTNHCAPSIVTLIRCDTGFGGGNWTNFYASDEILARQVMQNPYGKPRYLFCWYEKDEEGQEPLSPWPLYSRYLGSVAAPLVGWSGRNPLSLWSRCPIESVAS